jgi:tripartite-type tricarboxylate transporter receptor subunit TctC
MKRRRNLFMFLSSMMIISALISGLTYAQEKYPTRPIEVVTTFPPGATSELFVRTWGKYMEKALGQSVVVLAKPGGGGVVGFTYAANARPDGYTLLNAGDIFPPILGGTATYKLEDFRIIAQISTTGIVMCVAPDAPWKTWQEFVDYAKKNPGVKFAHPGMGTMAYYRIENLNRQLGLKMVSLPSQGDAESITRLLGKHVPVAFVNTSTAKSYIEAEKMRAILSLDPAKEWDLPESIPDLVRLYGKDFPDIEVVVLVFAPAKTPEHIIQALEKAFEEMSKNKEYAADLKKLDKKPCFVPGKLAMEKSRKRMELMKAIIAEQPKTK